MPKQSIKDNPRKNPNPSTPTYHHRSARLLFGVFIALTLSIFACKLPVNKLPEETEQPVSGNKSQTLAKLTNLEATSTALSAAIQNQLTAIFQNGTPSTNATPSPRSTYKTGTLSGIVFFDLDGDGLQSKNESPIGGIRLCLNNPESENCITSNSDGTYLFENIPQREHKLTIFNPETKPTNTFRYINHNSGWVEIPAYKQDGVTVPAQHLPDTQIQPISEPIIIAIDEQTRRDIALMQGYLTNVFTCQDWSKVRRIQYFDHDPAVGAVRNYLGDTKQLDFADDAAPGTEDNHTATDFGSSYHSIIGTYILAAAGGVVSFTGGYETPHGTCLIVDLVHPELGHRTGYVHLDKILVKDDQIVRRGQILGTLGMTCTTWPHVHFHIQTEWDLETNKWIPTDPYRDTLDPNAVSYWTKDNDPQCPPYAGDKKSAPGSYQQP